jgi:hypothetical protein
MQTHVENFMAGYTLTQIMGYDLQIITLATTKRKGTVRSKTYYTMQLKSSFIIAASLFAVIASAAPDFCTPGYQPIQDSNLKLDLSKLSR